MTFTISLQAWEDLQQDVNEINQTTQRDPLDPLDITWQIPKVVGHGCMRWIELREGLVLEITNFRLCDRLVIDCPEHPSWLKFHFHLSGQHEDKLTINRQIVVGAPERWLELLVPPKFLNNGYKPT